MGTKNFCVLVTSCFADISLKYFGCDYLIDTNKCAICLERKGSQLLSIYFSINIRETEFLWSNEVFISFLKRLVYILWRCYDCFDRIKDKDKYA